MNILLVEDEDIAAKKLTKTLEAVEPDATVVAVTSSVGETVSWLRTYGTGHPTSPDLILMDIELADGQSFQIFEQIPVNVPVIFTTSYDEYALKAFKVNSIDYLLKPVQKDELRAALDKFLGQKAAKMPTGVEASETVRLLVQELQKQLQPKAYRQRFLVQYVNKLLSIETHQIAYFFTDNRLNQLQTLDGRKMIVDYSLDEVEAMLDPAHFFRVSRSFLVSIGSVDQVQTYFGNRLALKLKPGTDKEVVVSREKLTPFKEWMGK
ncbi:LytR/AlgR family response regulator transcription factor [Fibrella aquatilis]|uniref:Response regulator transcription factor n=1 Tax=Fibrella aquatilis TaxID=2817059 RepID=A0A939G9D2_9BACT|nr:LytTR family DNA-binding domain-containing protein [Fibrella aquatilis]MBO0932522.1 response regulator transcription factor [Fibrella aquatilis]